MVDFFNLLDETIITRGDEDPLVPYMKTLSTYKRSCQDCGLYDSCISPKLGVYGNGEKKILIVGDCPSKEEDKLGSLGTGKALFFLKDTFKELGLSFKNDVWYTTALICRPKRGTINSNNIQICSKKLNKLIEKLKPKAIILLGEYPFDSLIYPRLTGRIQGTSWTSFIGDCIPDQQYSTYLIQTNHPTYLMSTKTWDDGSESTPLIERDPSIYKSFKKDILKAYEVANGAFYQTNYQSDCFIEMNEKDAIEVILDALEWKYMSFDYETTGRKPHREGHKIKCISISNGMVGYAFPFFNTEKFKKSWKKLMLSSVKKIAHNIAFEAIWTREICGYWPENMYWDTMLGQHCIRSNKPCGLKYLVYKEFGDIGYDDACDPYLKATNEEEELYGANAMNRIDSAPLEKLLTYNALDSLYTYKLFEIQKDALIDDLRNGFDFLLESAIHLAKTQQNGLVVNTDIMKEADEKLDGLLEESRQKILRSDEVSKYDASYFNFNSGTQLAHLLFDILKVKPVAFTESGLPSVDKDALPKYDLPFIKDILEYRKIDKIKKYINQYRKETVNNLVHPYFNLHTVDTFRSSSNAPNVQNVIKRDKMAMKLLRSFIKPRRGNRIVSYDLKSAEVYVSACYNKDPTLINYLMNPSTDMHRSFAADVFFLDEKDVSKDLRGDIKGQVFATFYGSFYKQIAPDCWEIGQKHNLIDHLKGNRIKNYIQFEEHMQKVERKFWDVRFPVYKRWRENQFNSYKENGFVEFKTGFRAYGPMSRNNSFNTPIQGSSYHMLQWGFNQVAKMMEKECERSFMLAEVHDSIIMDVHPSEEHLIDYWVWDYCTQKVREHWPWITLPIQMEKEASEIDGDWSELKTIGYLKGE